MIGLFCKKAPYSFAKEILCWKSRASKELYSLSIIRESKELYNTYNPRIQRARGATHCITPKSLIQRVQRVSIQIQKEFYSLSTGTDTEWRRPIGYLKLSCGSFFAKEPRTKELCCEKWSVKIRHPMTPRHSVFWIYLSNSALSNAYRSRLNSVHAAIFKRNL